MFKPCRLFVTKNMLGSNSQLIDSNSNSDKLVELSLDEIERIFF